MKRWLRPVWVVFALLFLLEAWLWDHLSPLVARLVNLIPLDWLKERIVRLVERLPPWAVLFVFLVPFVLLLPLKFLEVWLLATRQWLAAVVVLLVGKLVGLGVTAFIFDATRDKLMTMAWFRRVYDVIIALRDWANSITAPVRDRVRQLLWFMKRDRASRFFRRLMWLRRRGYRNRAA